MPQKIRIECVEREPFDPVKAAEEYNRKRMVGGEPMGILFGDNNALKYLGIRENKVYTIDYADSIIFTICNDGKEVYFDDGIEKVCSLSGLVRQRSGYTLAICQHKGRIIDAGDYGLFDTLENRILLDEKKTRLIGDKGVNSLSSHNGLLFGLIGNDYPPEHEDWEMLYFRILDEKNGKYELGEKLIDYGPDHCAISQAILLPFPSEINGKQYPFSVLSCANLRYLDINGIKVEGNDAKEIEQKIHRVALLSISAEGVDVIYSGHKLNTITRARIDVSKRKVIASEVLVLELSEEVCALDTVRNEELHQKIIKKGEEYASENRNQNT